MYGRGRHCHLPIVAEVSDVPFPPYCLCPENFGFGGFEVLILVRSRAFLMTIPETNFFVNFFLVLVGLSELWI